MCTRSTYNCHFVYLHTHTSPTWDMFVNISLSNEFISFKGNFHVGHFMTKFEIQEANIGSHFTSSKGSNFRLMEYMT